MFWKLRSTLNINCGKILNDNIIMQATQTHTTVTSERHRERRKMSPLIQN